MQYAKKMQGRKMVGGQSTNIPLKVNTAGVIPVIFASSLMSFPNVIASLLGKNQAEPESDPKIMTGLSQSSWCDPSRPIYSLGLVLYIVLVVFFA